MWGCSGDVEQAVRVGGAEATEAQLQAIAKAAFEDLLGELCTDQRSSPHFAEHHSAANLAFADYYDRLARHGGHLSLMEQEERQLADRGWDDERISDLRHIVSLREDKGVSRLRDELIDVKLRAAGLEPSDESRWMVELVLYPAYRDAHLDAEVDLRRTLGTLEETLSERSTTPAAGPKSTMGQTSPTPSAAPADLTPTGSAIPTNWRLVTPTEAAERLILYRPAMWEHRRNNKRAVGQVGEQTLRQIRWAATLLEKSMAGRPLWTMTKEDLKELDKWFERLPITTGKAPWHRAPATTLEEICMDAETRIEEGDCEADVIGLEVGTTNKHFRKLGQIHLFMSEQIGDAVARLDFSTYISPDIKDARNALAAYTVEQGKELFLLPA